MHRWAEHPHEARRIALYYEDELGQRQAWSYRRLAETANRLANGLIKMKVAPGDRVAVVMGQRAETIIACMAIFSVGAIAVPLSPVSGAENVGLRVHDAQAHVAIVDGHSGPVLLAAQKKCPHLTQIIGLEFQHESIIPWHSLMARQTCTFKLVPTRAASAALLLYTAGATGTPKGVLLSHSALIGNLPGFVASQNWFPQKSDVFWTPADWTCAGGLMNALLPTLYFGHSIVGTGGQLSAKQSFEVMERYQVTNAFLFPGVLKKMMNEVSAPRERYQLTLRCIMATGATIEPAVFEWCERALGVTPNEMFGQTEMNHLVGNSHQKWPARPNSLGRPYPGHRVAVLDAHGQPCPTGTVGDIALNRRDIHGHPDPVLFLGYWHNELASQAKFVGDWCLTGDLAQVDKDGYFWYAGRRDDAFKSPNYRIQTSDSQPADGAWRCTGRQQTEAGADNTRAR